MARSLKRGSDGTGVCCSPRMTDGDAGARVIAEAALGHPVPAVLPAEDGHPIVAGSVAGDPPRARVAWVDVDGGVRGRIACPPGRPSRWRPLVAGVVALELGPLEEERVLVARAAPEAAAVRPVWASEEPPPSALVGAAGLALLRLPDEVPVLAVDALDASGEPIGRLARAGISELRFDGRSVSGRMGSTHGMAAGIGAGRWAASLADAAFEVGYDPWLPAWTPPGLVRGRPRVEPDVSYPVAPPALVLAWSGRDGARVLLRQAPAPLASPEVGGPHAEEVDIAGAAGVLRGRRLVTLVWETADRAFGLQVRSMTGAEETALRVARSVSPETLS
jgi:hypothetical protein